MRVEIRIDLRSSALALLAESVDNLGHLFATGAGIDFAAAETHTDLLMSAGHEKPLQQQMAHVHAHKDTTVAAAILLGGVIQMQKPDRRIQKSSKFACHGVGFPNIPLV